MMPWHTTQPSHVLQDILDSGTHSDLLAAAQLLKSYNGALQHQVSRHQYAVHILQVLLKEQVMVPHHHYHCDGCCYCCCWDQILAGCMSVVSLHVSMELYYMLYLFILL